MARKPAEVNVEARALSDVETISSITGWSILRWSSACRQDMESVKIKNLFLLECSMHSRASSMARASAVKKWNYDLECDDRSCD